MKKKTIEKVLNQKFNNWAQTIKDQNVKKLVQNNTIITGGCIASMLLKEQINDFDIYFTNKETVLAVAKYYVDEFKKTPHCHLTGKQINIEVVDCDNATFAQESGIIGVADAEPGRVKIHIKSAGIVGAGGESNYQYFESKPAEEAEDYVDKIVSQVADQEA